MYKPPRLELCLCGWPLASKIAWTNAVGFPTPFPEPDSPLLQRFAVRSPKEIVGQLLALQEAAVPLSAFVDAGERFGVVTLRRVDEAAGELVFAGPADEGLRARLLSAPLATFVGFDDAGKIQFAAAPAPASGLGGSGLTAPIPDQLFRLQRRSTARVRLESARAAICRIPLPGGAGEREALRVLDVGTGGIAVLTYPERFEAIVGAEIDDCRLDLPGVGGAVVSLRVRHVGPQSGKGQARCCGCEFLHMSPGVMSLLAHFVRGPSGPT